MLGVIETAARVQFMPGTDPEFDDRIEWPARAGCGQFCPVSRGVELFAELWTPSFAS